MNYNLGRVLPIFRGTYDNTAQYTNLDVVYFNGSSYVATGDTVGNTPTDTEHWVPVAMAGTLSPEQVEAIQQEVIAYVQAQGYVIDANYVHTDNNFTNAEKSKLDGIDMSTKQDTLVSGQNIATINGNNLLEGGNIEIQTGGGGGGTTDYTDLTNKPSINGVVLSGNKTTSQLGINIPARTSDLTNDSGFLTSETEPAFNSSVAKNITNADITNWNSKQDTLVSGTNIKTINGNNLLGSGNINIDGSGTPVQYNEVLIDFSQYDSLNAYLSINNNSITSSTSDTSWTYLIPVTKGERFIAYITPVDGATSTSNYTIAGFSQNKPAIGSSITNKTLFVAKGQSTTSLRKGTLEIIAPYNGWMVFYFNSNTNTSVLYEMTTDGYNVPVYDTYIEEDIEEKIATSVANSSGTGNFVKWYNLQQGIDYKVIYAHAVYNTINQNTNSLEFYNDNGDLLGTSGDASETTMIEHRMEDLNTIMENLNIQGATKLKMNYLVYASTKGGNPLSGCAALMKPLLDDNTMPKNDIVYCVSKIKKPVHPYNYSTEETTFPQEELWSAWAVRFPSGHTLSGKPTPLCSFFHGSSAYVTSEKIGYPTYGATINKQLNDRGIAVFDINGYGISFLSDNYSRHWGCPAAVETVKSAYNVLTERFNCRKGMVLSGISMGGAIIKSYAMTYPEDCVACAMEAPSEMGITFRSTTGVGTEVLDAWDLTTRDANAICGYTPFANPYVIDTQNGNVLVHRNITDWTYSDFLKLKSGATSTTPINYEATDLQASAPFPVESVIWHGDADNNVSYGYSVMFERITRNAGSNVKLRLCPNCDHDLDTYPWVCDEVVNYIESKLK